MDDDRNRLFHEYRGIVDALAPDGFVFENVPGLLNMDGGRVFADVCSALSGSMSDIRADVLKTERYGIPQRRWRVFVLARRDGPCPPPPAPISDFPPPAAERRGLAVTPGALDAIGDLPPLAPREDGSDMPLGAATSDFQRLCREEIAPAAYVEQLRARTRRGRPVEPARVVQPTTGP
jgi:DNA (cytosine-5)-methyltransferase 1